MSAKAYQDTEQKPNLSRNSSSSSSSSPVQESEQKLPSPPAATTAPPPPQSLVIHDQDTGAIYEEINDDIVSDYAFMQNNIKRKSPLKIQHLYFFHLFAQYIPKPKDPPPPLPQDSVYDLDVNPSKSNTASPSRNVATRTAPSVPPNAMATPPPLPKRQNAAHDKQQQSELPKVPARSGAPPPLPARPNAQM